MTADEIRKIGTAAGLCKSSDRPSQNGADYLSKWEHLLMREIAAQLAELNNNLRALKSPAGPVQPSQEQEKSGA